MQKPLIYLVDDNEVSLLLWTDMLATQNVECLSYSSGETALEAMQQRIPDLVVLDLLMPGMDGFDVCRVMRSNPEFQSVPVLMVTSMNDSKAKKTGLELGASDFLVKPVMADDLIAHCKRLLAKPSIQERREEDIHLDDS